MSIISFSVSAGGFQSEELEKLKDYQVAIDCISNATSEMESLNM